MAKGQKGFVKGESGNINGKPKGAQNRTTREARELLQNILFGEIDHIKDTLEAVRLKDESKYLEAVHKMFSYVLPKKIDVTTDDEPIHNETSMTDTQVDRIIEALKPDAPK